MVSSNEKRSKMENATSEFRYTTEGIDAFTVDAEATDVIHKRNPPRCMLQEPLGPGLVPSSLLNLLP